MPIRLFGKRKITLYCDSFTCGQSQKFVFIRDEGNEEVYACTVCGAERKYTVR